MLGQSGATAPLCPSAHQLLPATLNRYLHVSPWTAALTRDRIHVLRPLSRATCPDHEASCPTNPRQIDPESKACSIAFYVTFRSIPNPMKAPRPTRARRN